MATVTFSPLVVGLSGRAGDAIFSRWKGRAYVRQHVVPHNPKSDDQKVVRESLARLPRLWRSLEGQIHDVQDAYAAAYSLSGWNWFVKHNRKIEQDYEAGYLTPPNVTIDPIATLALTDSGGGVCKVDWTGGERSADHKIYLVSRRISDGKVETEYTLQDSDTTLVSEDTFNATLEASETFLVALAVEAVTDSAFSLAVYDTIVMGA